jgi:hypothetical protein
MKKLVLMIDGGFLKGTVRNAKMVCEPDFIEAFSASRRSAEEEMQLPGRRIPSELAQHTDFIRDLQFLTLPQPREARQRFWNCRRLKSAQTSMRGDLAAHDKWIDGSGIALELRMSQAKAVWSVPHFLQA